jgi:hypothetical protein
MKGNKRYNRRRPREKWQLKSLNPLIKISKRNNIKNIRNFWTVTENNREIKANNTINKQYKKLK